MSGYHLFDSYPDLASEFGKRWLEEKNGTQPNLSPSSNSPSSNSPSSNPSSPNPSSTNSPNSGASNVSNTQSNASEISGQSQYAHLLNPLLEEVKELREKNRLLEEAIAQQEARSLEETKRQEILDLANQVWKNPYANRKPLELKYAPVSRPRGVWGANADFRNKGGK